MECTYTCLRVVRFREVRFERTGHTRAVLLHTVHVYGVNQTTYVAGCCFIDLPVQTPALF